ncbi:MAG TPA: hypothetical protein VGP81_04660 [Pyrinomonadaceae bacterium]|nr:hypothetical protein [Pyrinomonadaceae bacterium]
MRKKIAAHEFPARKLDSIIGIGIFAITLLVFLLTPTYIFSDSKFTFVLSESLLKHRSFALDDFALPHLEPRHYYNYTQNGSILQLEWVDGHLYYYPPPGGSILSIPYVALMDLFGVSSMNPDGTYNPEAEQRLQAIFGSFLMAVVVVVFYFTSRLLLPISWSGVLSLGSAFGTQVWSTMSRAVYADTWGVVLLAVTIWLLLAVHLGRIRLWPILLATLLAWTYFVRPTNSIPVLAVAIYLLIYYRRAFVKFSVTGLAWLVLFVAYSWWHFHKMLPNYYLASRLTFERFSEALPGTLISPARGLFVYVPVILFVGYLLGRYRRHVGFHGLLFLALSIFAAHWLAVSAFPHWWGGMGYGPRLMSGIVPWIVLLGIFSVQAMLRAREHLVNQSRTLGKLELTGGVALLVFSIFTNGVGATTASVVFWHEKPESLEKRPSRLWDWRYPQFMAPFLYPPLPKLVPPGDVPIDFSRKSSEPYLLYGWGRNEPEFRWSEGHKSVVIFSLDEPTDSYLRMKVMPWLVPGRVEKQRATISLNGNVIETLTLKDPAPLEYSRALPKETFRRDNVLTFTLPDATSGHALGLNDDPRELGIGIFSLEIKPAFESIPRLTQTVADAPLPVGGYEAELLPLDVPSELRTGQTANVRVKIKNISGAIWPAGGLAGHKYQVRLGNHWRDASGRLVTGDDGRAALPYDLRPRQEVELLLPIQAPQTPGEYILEFDMVQEVVAWFANEEQSQVARIKVVVR